MLKHLYSELKISTLHNANLNVSESEITNLDHGDIYYQTQDPIQESLYVYISQSQLIPQLITKLNSNLPYLKANITSSSLALDTNNINHDCLRSSSPEIKFNGVYKCFEVGFGTGLNALLTLNTIKSFRQQAQNFVAASLDANFNNQLVKQLKQFNYALAQEILESEQLNFLEQQRIKKLCQGLVNDRYIQAFLKAHTLSLWQQMFTYLWEHLSEQTSLDHCNNILNDYQVALGQKFIFQYCSSERTPLTVKDLEQNYQQSFAPRLLSSFEYINNHVSLAIVTKFVEDLFTKAKANLKDSFVSHFSSHLEQLLKQQITDPSLNAFISNIEPATNLKQLVQKLLVNLSQIFTFFMEVINFTVSKYLVNNSPFKDIVLAKKDIFEQELQAFSNQFYNDLIAYGEVTYNCCYTQNYAADIVQIYYDDLKNIFLNYAAGLGKHSFDVIYLDGFAPEKNADLWNSNLYAILAYLSKEQTRITTFTSNTKVSKGLKQVGFTIINDLGFNKRNHLTGYFSHDEKLSSLLSEYQTTNNFVKDKLLQHLKEQNTNLPAEQLNSELYKIQPFYKQELFAQDFYGVVEPSLINKLYLLLNNNYLPTLLLANKELSNSQVYKLIQGNNENGVDLSAKNDAVINVFGHGIAGVASAYYLNSLGLATNMYSTTSQEMASINPAGLFYPQLVDDDPAVNFLHLNAFKYGKVWWRKLQKFTSTTLKGSHSQLEEEYVIPQLIKIDSSSRVAPLNIDEITLVTNQSDNCDNKYASNINLAINKYVLNNNSSGFTLADNKTFYLHGYQIKVNKAITQAILALETFGRVNFALQSLEQAKAKLASSLKANEQVNIICLGADTLTLPHIEQYYSFTPSSGKVSYLKQSEWQAVCKDFVSHDLQSKITQYIVSYLDEINVLADVNGQAKDIFTSSQFTQLLEQIEHIMVHMFNEFAICDEGYALSATIDLNQDVIPPFVNYRNGLSANNEALTLNQKQNLQEVIIFGATHKPYAASKIQDLKQEALEDNKLNCHNFACLISKQLKDYLANLIRSLIQGQYNVTEQEHLASSNANQIQLLDLSVANIFTEQLIKQLATRIYQNLATQDTIQGTRIKVRDRFYIAGSLFNLDYYQQQLKPFIHHKYKSDKLPDLDHNLLCTDSNYYLTGMSSRGLTLAPLASVNLIHHILGLSLCLPDALEQKVNPQRQIASKILSSKFNL
ncbi:MnmC family methyltransferase [Psittacicella hinzii]|uniref:MnmC-like methyltransferase domain-containing protein n=1 Tax=Psittacicella hinzii TaxID=2028575 RepID=A0A3A1YFV9_9GAMM|nr:MnmC family methyltransferase [Psittacicella hinzii]RIY34927.1 hypothetical protein CKF58_07380 [Psittacicella hinzii]